MVLSFPKISVYQWLLIVILVLVGFGPGPWRIPVWSIGMFIIAACSAKRYVSLAGKALITQRGVDLLSAPQF